MESVRAHLIDLLTPAQIEALGDVFDLVLNHLRDNGEGCTPCDEPEDQVVEPSSASSTSSRRTPSKNKIASK